MPAIGGLSRVALSAGLHLSHLVTGKKRPGLVSTSPGQANHFHPVRERTLGVRLLLGVITRELLNVRYRFHLGFANAQEDGHLGHNVFVDIHIDGNLILKFAVHAHHPLVHIDAGANVRDQLLQT